VFYKNTPLVFSGVKMLRVKDVLTWIDDFAPLRYSAPWDNCGIQVGDPGGIVKRILVALDPCSWTLKEAQERDCQCLVTHHPLLMRPLHTLRFDKFPGNLIATAVREGIHLIAAHTNLDVARFGTNDQIARILMLRDATPLEIDKVWKGEECYMGLGLIGVLPQPTPLHDFIKDVRNAFGGIPLRAVGDPERTISRIALCSGSGGSLIETVIAAGVDLYLSGDIKHHEALLALEANLSVVDIGHFASEAIVIKPLADYLQQRALSEGLSLEVLTARKENDPFWFSI
jgi:dinuclear metal center YbgI/SA1388 family protein